MGFDRLLGFQLGLLLCVAFVARQVVAFDSSVNVNDIIVTDEFDRNNEAHLEELFEIYKTQYEKDYPSAAAEAIAFNEFKASVILVLEHNAEADQGIHSWWIGINQFSDGTRPHTGLLPPPDRETGWRRKKNYRNQVRRRSP